MLYATLHASAAPPRVGLTQALGTMKTFSIPLLVFAVFFTCSCTTTSFTPQKNTYVPCVDRNYCGPENVENASLETLKSKESTISVTCGTNGFDTPISESYRAKCRDRIERLTGTLSNKWAEHLQPITTSSVKYIEHTGFITFVSGECFEAHSIEAVIPLLWISK